ncbi:MAG: hypothetical protein J5714_00235 [Alphaproteobacteria bacterium]|nr:hypothetical protein [Alphaproteobacteria bacterium]
MSNIVYEKNVFSTPFLSGYAELKIPIVDKDGTTAWPAVFPIDKIEKIRKTVGERHFSAQMMLQFVAPDKIRLDPSGIKFYDTDFDPYGCRIGETPITGATIYWDPSGGRRNSDNSVCVIIYRDDRTHHVFVHDMVYLVVPDGVEYPLAYQCERVLGFVRAHRQRTLALETNGIGAALPEIMRETIRRAGYEIQIRPITNSRRKEDRILDAIEPLLTTGRFYAHRRISQTPFLSEMLAWTPIGSSEHDDGLDAVAGAILCSPVPTRAIGTNVRNYIANTDFKL